MELAAKGQPDPGTWIPPLDTKDSKDSMESSSWQYRNIKSRARFPYRELAMSWGIKSNSCITRGPRKRRLSPEVR